MKINFLTKTCLFGLVALATIGIVGCGKKELVTFEQVSGTYDMQSYSVAKSTWKKQEDQEGFDGVWSLTGTVKYDNNTGTVLHYGAADTKHFVAINFKHDDKVEVQDPKYYVNSSPLKDFDDGNKESFTLIKAISENSQDFTVTIYWNKDTSVKYKFLIDKQNFTLQSVPQA